MGSPCEEFSLPLEVSKLHSKMSQEEILPSHFQASFAHTPLSWNNPRSFQTSFQADTHRSFLVQTYLLLEFGEVLFPFQSWNCLGVKSPTHYLMTPLLWIKKNNIKPGDLHNHGSNSWAMVLKVESLVYRIRGELLPHGCSLGLQLWSFAP